MRPGVDTPNRKRSLIAGAGLTVGGAALLAAGATVVGNLLVLSGVFIVFNYYILTPAATRFQMGFLPRLENAYEALVRVALRGRNPWYFFFGTAGLMVLSIVLLAVVPPKVEFFPSNEPQYVNIFISKPIGTDIGETDRITREVETLVDEVLAREEFKRPNPETGENESFIVNSVIALVGNGTSDPAEGPQLGDTPNKARIAVNFVKFPDRRGLSTKEVLNALREQLKGYPDAEVVVTKNSDGPPQGPPINIELRGEDYDAVLAAATGMRQFLREVNVAGVEELKIDVNKQKPELPVVVDRERARQYGLSTQDVGFAIRSALYGREVSTFKDGEDDYPINLRFAEEARYDVDALMNQKIIFRSPSDGQIKEVPISAVATPARGTTFSAVKRKDLDRVITLSSNVLEGANANEIVGLMKEKLADYQVPEGVSWTFTGQQEEQAKELAFLSKALLAALFLIFLIIVAQFNSVSRPFIIGFSVVFSLIGVLLGLVIFRMDFVIIMTMIGIISLAGVVVNNAIVLIDYTDLVTTRAATERGVERIPFAEVTRAIIEGGRTRLRPVLLTAITTVLGLYPLAVGFNIDFFTLISDYDPNIYMGGDNNVFWKPMSWAIIYGLTFATFLTLVIVPVMYWWMLRMKYKYLWKEGV
jgi:multidrug efflux pump subunit AcrB